MCDPVTAAMTTAAVLKAGAQVAQGVSAYNTGKAQQKQYQQEAQSSIQASNIEANRLRTEGEAEIGSQRVIQAASGIDITSGSAADVSAETARGFEEDALTVLYRGRLGAHSAITKGKFARAQGSAALTQGIIGGTSTLLTSGADQGWFK